MASVNWEDEFRPDIGHGVGGHFCKTHDIPSETAGRPRVDTVSVRPFKSFGEPNTCSRECLSLTRPVSLIPLEKSIHQPLSHLRLKLMTQTAKVWGAGGHLQSPDRSENRRKQAHVEN